MKNRRIHLNLFAGLLLLVACSESQNQITVFLPVSKNKIQGFIYDAQGQRVSYDGHEQKIKL